MISTSPDREDASRIGLRRYVPLAVCLLTVLTILVIPLKIIGYGYLPNDDALRHAAKAVSGKPWPEILVLRNGYSVDHNFGWHALLRQIHLATGGGSEALLIISVVGLFALLGWSALPWLKRPEAWLGTLLLVAGVGSNFMVRFMLGRPFLLSLSVLLTILFLWERRGDSRPGWRTGAGLTTLIALAVLVHGVWYLWALPVAAFFLARQYRWGVVLAASWLAGAFLGAAFTGHPFTYLREAVNIALGLFSRHQPQLPVVTELQPTPGNLFGLLLLGGVLVLNRLAKLEARPLDKNPAFWLACLGWILGYKATRFWEDWGLPALMVLMTVNLDLFLRTRWPAEARQRLVLAGGLAAALFLSTTSDLDNRWTRSLNWQFISQDDPSLAGWLPDQGGTFYAADLSFFYQTFFKNPKAGWRYALGFEPTLMPDDDLATFQSIQLGTSGLGAYKPWVDKMRPGDRLMIRWNSAQAPPTPGLEWHSAVGGMWIGRKR